MDINEIDEMGNVFIKIYVQGINEIPKDVETAVIYCRVSTTHDSQEMSLKAQVQLAIEYAEKKNYFIIGVFVERESAKSDVSREAYMAMIGTVSEYKPTYILAKSSDRIARSIEVESALQRICRNSGTKIQYVMDGRIINPDNMNDLMTSSFEAVANQHVSLIQHRKAVEVNKRKWENPYLTKCNECFGFRFNKQLKQMEVFEPEARYVRKIFEKYVYEGLGTVAISNYLAENGLTGMGANNHLISANAILKWLRNEAYIGKMHIRTRTTDFRFGAGEKSVRRELPKEEHIIVPVPPIVDEELFNLAQEILDQKREMHARVGFAQENCKENFSGKHLFSTKVYCGECGSSMLFKYVDRAKTKGIYKCSCKKKAKRKEHNKNFDRDDVITCSSAYQKIQEDLLSDAIGKAIDTYSSKEKEIYDNLMLAIENVLNNQRKKADNPCKQIQEQINKLKNKCEKIKTSFIYAEDKDLIDSLQEDYKASMNQIRFLQSELENEAEQENVIIDNRFRIERIRNYLNEIIDCNEVTRETVLRYIDKIVVTNEGVIEVYLKYNQLYEAIVCSDDNGQQSLSLNRTVENRHIQGMTEA